MAGIKYINNIPVCDKEMRDKLAALKELLDGKANKIHTHDEYITRDELEENYATKAYVDTNFLEIDDLIDDIDLSIYVTKQEVESKGYLTSIPSEYITESELNAMGFITSNQDVSGLATITTVDNTIAETKTFIDNTYALKSDADELKAWAERLRQEVDDLYDRYNALRTRVDGLQNKQPENPVVYCTGINIIDNVVSVENQKGSTCDIRYEVTPTNCSEAVVWSCDNSNITINNGRATLNNEITIATKVELEWVEVYGGYILENGEFYYNEQDGTTLACNRTVLIDIRNKHAATLKLNSIGHTFQQVAVYDKNKIFIKFVHNEIYGSNRELTYIKDNDNVSYIAADVYVVGSGTESSIADISFISRTYPIVTATCGKYSDTCVLYCSEESVPETVKILRPTDILESSVSIFDKEKMYDTDPNTYGYFRANYNEEFTIRFDSSEYPASTFKRLVFKVYQSYDADTNFQVNHGMNAQYWSGHRYFEYSETIHEISFESEPDFEYDIHDGDFYLTVRFGGNPGYIMGTDVEVRIYDIYMEF